MKKFIFILLFIAFQLGCGDNVTYTDVVDKPTLLIADIKSYQSIEYTKNQLVHGGYEWIVKEDSKSPQYDSRPPFDILTISIKKYNYLGFSGELVLNFFNNRLMSTWFYPDDISSFFKKLKIQLGTDMMSQSEITFGKYTKMWKDKDYQDRIYIGWHDIRLIEENNRWISRYS
jgi:hypothetical protein